jgi:hypothetical protein
MQVQFNKNDKKEGAKGGKKTFNTILSLVAYVAIGCIAIAILLALIFKNNSSVSNAFGAVGEAIAYSICIVLAFSWVRTHRQIPWIVCYVVFVVTIVVLYILTI